MSDVIHPKFLYRYRPYATCEHKSWVKEIILENKLYAPSPVTFNDPFDCKINFDMEASDEEIYAYVIRILKSKAGDVAESQISDIARSMVEGGRWKEILPDFMRSIFDSIGVISFSESPDEILLWSHYADKHRGVAFQFMSDQSDLLFSCSQVVDYRTQYPNIKAVDYGHPEKLTEILLVKSADWRYENEYRHITYEKGFGHVEYRPELLTGVIFGCDMKDDDKKEIADMIARREHKPVIYQARRAERRFGLVIDLL